VNRSIVNGHEILSDGRRVWVNGPDGAAVARYSSTAGRDVHRPMSEQRETGDECLDCSGDTDYDTFADSVLRHYRVAIPKKHRPRAATLTLAMRRALISLHRNGHPAAGIQGQSEHGGLTATMAALYHRGLVDDGKLTERGAKAAAKLAGEPTCPAGLFKGMTPTEVRDDMAKSARREGKP
jgi:hypothetical protein